jgi:hypothetical protein
VRYYPTACVPLLRWQRLSCDSVYTLTRPVRLISNLGQVRLLCLLLSLGHSVQSPDIRSGGPVGSSGSQRLSLQTTAGGWREGPGRKAGKSGPCGPGARPPLPRCTCVRVRAAGCLCRRGVGRLGPGGREGGGSFGEGGGGSFFRSFWRVCSKRPPPTTGGETRAHFTKNPPLPGTAGGGP